MVSGGPAPAPQTTVTAHGVPRNADAGNHLSGRRARAAVWLPGLVVTLGAAAATAHGLFEVAEAAHVPSGIAWLYPLITDGLALVAYAATARLIGPAARYAWTVVVIAAGLSGLAQAVYLTGGPTVDVAPALRFGVGAWPAIAAAVAAHLLYLLADPGRPSTGVQPRSVQPAVQSHRSAVVQPAPNSLDDPLDTAEEPGTPASGRAPAARARTTASPARDRAMTFAVRHAQRHGAWPTVSELEAVASVSRGTAAAALKAMRDQPLPLHLINTPDPTSETTTDDEAQP